MGRWYPEPNVMWTRIGDLC